MEKKIKIDCCFLIPNNSKKSYQKLSETYSAIEPPTWALLLAQSVRSVGFSPNIIDANAENLNENEILNRIIQTSPKLKSLAQPDRQSIPYISETLVGVSWRKCLIISLVKRN